MAGKQLGKFRQWAGEVISSKEKTTVTDEFKELEKEMDQRRDGLLRMHMSAEGYCNHVSKKKDSPALDDAEKLLPMDAMGIVMIVHGEELGNTTYGTSLVNFGRAHCKVATLQEAYTLTFRDTFLASIQRFAEDIKEYEAQRKKLESRRLAYDAAITKAEKAKSSKKEKDRMDAEDELQQAKQRYDETCEDVRQHMSAVQANEIDQQRELGGFLDLELNFVKEYLSVLEDVKADWVDPSHVVRPTIAADMPTHIFQRPSKEPKFSSVRSKRSMQTATPSHDSSDGSSDEAPPSATPVSRKSSTRRLSIHRKPESPVIKPPSRPSSRASRRRSDSAVTANGESSTSRITGWVGSVTGRSKKSKDKFASLQDDDDPASDNEIEKSTHSRSKSREISPNISARGLSSNSQKKTVKALYDFTGSSDELAFKTGDKIVVLNETLEGWWMGELDGKKGLFPTTYTEVIGKQLSPSLSPVVPSRTKTPPPARPASRGGVNGTLGISLGSILGRKSGGNKYPGPYGSGEMTPTDMGPETDGYSSATSDVDLHIEQPIVANARSPFYTDRFVVNDNDQESFVSHDEEEVKKEAFETHNFFSPPLSASSTSSSTRGIVQSLADQQQAFPSVSQQQLQLPSRPPGSSHRSTPSIPTTTTQKKTPPPPPPRRRSMFGHSMAPAIPDRPSTSRAGTGSINSSVGSLLSTHSHPRSNDVSPFESASELNGAGVEKKVNPFRQS